MAGGELEVTSSVAVAAPRLTNREMCVLGQVGEGLTNKQIAFRLGLSEKTVRNHLSNVFGKLEVTNRTEAVMTAMRRGMHVWNVNEDPRIAQEPR